MFKSRADLRRIVCLIDATVDRLHVKHPVDVDFFRSTDDAFSEVMTQCVREDDEWLFNLIDEVCTRHRMPYPIGA